MKVRVNRDRCKECGLCVHHCPKKAIGRSKQFNINGYFPVEIDDALCIACGICYITCPDGVFHVLGNTGKE